MKNSEWIFGSKTSPITTIRLDGSRYIASGSPPVLGCGFIKSLYPSNALYTDAASVNETSIKRTLVLIKTNAYNKCIILNKLYKSGLRLTGAFPNDDSLLKLLYMGIQNAQKKWTMPIRNWSLTISQLAIYFEGRLDNALNL